MGSAITSGRRFLVAQRENPMPGRTIGEHGIIGNMDAAALVATDGSIDFLCWPHLDSPSVFAALLDPDEGGEFSIAPALDHARTVQMYVPETNILITRWMSLEGSVEVTDFMPHPEVESRVPASLVRRVRVQRGSVRIHACCRPRLNYALSVPDTDAYGDSVVFHDGSQSLRLGATVPLTHGDGEASAEFLLEKGGEAWFVLCDETCDPLDASECAQALADTAHAWRTWARRSNYRGRWRERVERSALVLKLLTSHRHGSIAAAATFGLPEATGAERNWDYRATWMRDASFTVYAFMRLGYVDEAEHFRRWFQDRIVELGEDSALKIMYALDGREAAPESMLEHLAGYAGSQPVRIGNAARTQTQLDIFGELMDSLYLSNKYGSAISRDGWLHVMRMVDHVCRHWREPDEGIWEIRDEPRHFLHSRLMCWVALDRAVRLAAKRSLPGPVVAWTAERDRIADDIWTNFRHPVTGCFVQTRGSTDLDASLLMMPLVRFVSATDPVWLSTLDAIRDELTDDGLVFRYRNTDGLEGGEGAFTTCTFWYVECLARAGRLHEARETMARGVLYANHLGLFSEELSLLAEPLGNFPQAPGFRQCGLLSRSTAIPSRRADLAALDQMQVLGAGTRKHRAEVGGRQAVHSLHEAAQYVAVVVQHGIVTILEQALCVDRHLVACNASTGHLSAEHPVRRTVAVIGSLVAVLTERTAELGHHDNHGVVPFHRTQSVGKGGQALAKVVQVVRQLPAGTALVHVGVPAAHVNEAEAEAVTHERGHALALLGEAARIDRATARGHHFGLEVLRHLLAQLQAVRGSGLQWRACVHVGKDLRLPVVEHRLATALQRDVGHVTRAPERERQRVSEGNRRRAAEHRREAAHEARRIAARIGGFTGLDVVLCLEVAARHVVGAGERDESQLVLIPQG
jgi:GH15 family glucan-1,4-alpha-glucosidase